MNNENFDLNDHLEKVAAKYNKSSWLSNTAFVEQLSEIRNALLSGKYYTRVESVARSGMSRIIKIAYIENGSLYHVYNPDVLKIAGCDKNGRISGCGMDMLFAAQYNLFVTLCPDLRYQDAMKQYRNL